MYLDLYFYTAETWVFLQELKGCSSMLVESFLFDQDVELFC